MPKDAILWFKFKNCKNIFNIHIFILCFLFSGGFGAWSIVINAFISDTSETKDRSMRFGMLKLSETLGKPLGALLGNYIINKGKYVLHRTSHLLYKENNFMPWHKSAIKE